MSRSRAVMIVASMVAISWLLVSRSRSGGRSNVPDEPGTPIQALTLPSVPQFVVHPENPPTPAPVQDAATDVRSLREVTKKPDPHSDPWKPWRYQPEFTWGGAMDGASAILRALDRRVFVAMARPKGMYAFGKTPEARECGRQRADRLGTWWMVRASVRLKIKVAADEIRATGIEFDEDSFYLDNGDKEFHECMATAIKAAVIECPGCTPGEVEINWILAEGYSQTGMIER